MFQFIVKVFTFIPNHRGDKNRKIVLFVCGLSLQRQRQSVWQIVCNHRFVNDKVVSGKLCLASVYISYTQPITSSALNECLLVHDNF